MPAAYVKAYLKRNTTDAADAGAICEAVTHPTMPYVAVKGQQERQQVSFSELVTCSPGNEHNQSMPYAGHMAERGLVAAAGAKSCTKLIETVRD
ncbi:hypothetical protein CDO25_23465 (plasmid) [Sinorhizobium meliloti]|nr:hypothetical protein CDO25_23465 [Sinorhizobium meliloti]